MPSILCARCGREAPLMEKAPFRDDLGREIHEYTCLDCWKEWLEYQVKIINEMGLLPVNPEHAAILDKNVRAFLQLPSAGEKEIEEIGTPPEEG